MKVYAIRESLSGLYAGSSHGEWVKDHRFGLHFTERPRAEAFLQRLKDAPRQFAGLNKRAAIVEVEMGSETGSEDPKGGA